MNHSNNTIARVDPEILSSMEQFTLPQILYKQAERFGPTKTAIREKACGIWQAINWDAYFRYTQQTALGLMALGINRGDTVGLLLDNGPEWLFGELGTQSAGAVAVPISTSATDEIVVSELNEVQAAYVFAQDQRQVDRLQGHHQELPYVEQIIYIDPTGLKSYEDDPRLIAFAQLLELGEELDDEQPDLFIKELWDGKPEDMAVMLRTSGTAGSPKLAMLSHTNFINTACTWIATEPIGAEDNWLSLSSMPWIMEQIWGLGIALCGGVTTNFPERPETVLEDVVHLRPTFITGSAHFWEDLSIRIIQAIGRSGKWHRLLFDRTLEAANLIATLESEGKPRPWGLKVKNELLKRLVSGPLLRRIGCGRVRAAYTGGHPISPDIITLFRNLGLNLKQYYGLTETCGMVHVHREGDVKPETVGRPLPGNEIKLSADREILIRSRSNFMGYYQYPDLTARVLKDGWLHTGDAGYLDGDGHLGITGRK